MFLAGERERAKIPWNQQQELSHWAGSTPTRVIHLCSPSWCSECQLTLSPVKPAALEQHGMCINVYKHTAGITSQLIWAINKMARSLGRDSPTRCEMADQIAASNTLFSCSIITIQKTLQYILCEKKSITRLWAFFKGFKINSYVFLQYIGLWNKTRQPNNLAWHALRLMAGS